MVKTDSKPYYSPGEGGATFAQEPVGDGLRIPAIPPGRSSVNPLPMTSILGRHSGIEGIGGFIEKRQDHIKMIEDVRRYEAQLRAVLDAVPCCVSWVGSDLRYLGVNECLAEAHHLAPEAFVGRPLGFLRSGPEFDQYAREFVNGSERESTREITSLVDGQPRQHLVFARKYDNGRAAVFVGVDITERKRIEQQVSASQKMETMGTLAGGIAHDFGNILTSILGCTRLAMKSLREGSDAHKCVDMAHRAAERAEGLVRQILSYCRRDSEERQPLLLARIVEESMKLLQSSLPATIEIRQELGGQTGLILADPTRIQQIIMNLCVNAVHAMRRSAGGETIEKGILRVGLEDARVERETPARVGALAPGPYLKLTIADTGHGMDRETMERIFEPFFTTKPRGEGVGMGLATVKEIVTSHEGAMNIASAVGAGTTFEIYFPRLEGWRETAGHAQAPVRRGHESVLVVDDEETVVNVTTCLLQEQGYAARGCMSSVEALELFRLAPDEYDILITDQSMPKMVGTALAQEIFRLRPGFPVILCTGLTEGITPEKARELGIREFIYKPITYDMLSATIRHVLDAEAGAEDSSREAASESSWG
jgi:signal transduction histidine kinase/CheY-like chemotaxis protein